MKILLFLFLLCPVSVLAFFQGPTICKWSQICVDSGGDPFAITVGQTDTTAVYVPDNYTSGFTPPAKGGTYVDSKFGTTIKRMTDGWVDVPNSGYTGEYSQRSHYNANNSRLLVTDPLNGGFNVISTATLAVTHVTPISGSGEPSWDHQNPDIIYFTSGNQFRKYDCATSSATTVVAFNGTGGRPNYSSIFGGGGGDLSEDGDHYAILGDGRHVGVYKISTGEFSATPRDFTADEDIGSVSMMYDNRVMIGFNTRHQPGGPSPMNGTVSITSGTNVLNGVGTTFLTQTRQGGVLHFPTMTGGTKVYVVSNVASDTSLTLESNVTGTISGVSNYEYMPRIVLYDKNMNYLYVISKFSGHSTWGRDPSTGEEVFLIDNANSLSGLAAGCENAGLEKYVLGATSATRSCFFGYPDFNLTGHSSFVNARGHPWVSMSYYDGRTASTGTARLNAILRSDWAAAGVWKRNYNEVWIKNISTGEVRRLAHHRTRITGILGYWFTSRAAISKDAAYISFASAMHVFRNKTGTGTVSTTNGSPDVVGSGTTFQANASSVTHGGEMTINGVTKIVTVITDQTHLTNDSNWAATQSGQTYTAWHPDIVDQYRITLRAETTDHTAPTMSNFGVSNITSNSATVTWDTDEAATSQVEWGTTTFYGGGISAFSTTKVTSHSVNLTGLPSGVTINIRRKSRDAAGNIKLDSNRTFVTL